MSHLEEFIELAVEHGRAVNDDVDMFEEHRVTAVGAADTVKMLFDAAGKFVAAYRWDARKRQWRTERIGVTKGWLAA